MTWHVLPAPLSKEQKAKHAADPVTLRVSKEGRFVRRAFLTVRPSILDGGGSLLWWTHSAAVAVAIGRGEHAGQLRITPDGVFRLRGASGKCTPTGNPNPPQLVLFEVELPGLLSAPEGRLPLEYDYGEDWLEVTLPHWSRQLVAPALAKLSAPPPAKGVPFRGALASSSTAINGSGRRTTPVPL